MIFPLICAVAFIVPSTHARSITVKDKMGREVSIEIPVKRAVLFETYELVPALGTWDRIVGISRWAYENTLIKAAMPGIRKRIPSVGTGMNVNIEALLKLRPDLVIIWAVRPEVIQAMESRGIKVIAVYPESLGELYEVIRLHGRLFGKERRAEEVIRMMEKVLDLIRSRVKDRAKRKVLWLWSKPTRVSGGIGIQNELIGIVGGTNPASYIRSRYPEVSLERISMWDPDLIFIWGNARYGPEDILRNPQWRRIRAVKEGDVFKAPEWSTWSPRLALIALWMAMKAHPEAFRGMDFRRMADEFYRSCFGIPYKEGAKI